jgi:hypothetical protein
MLYYTGNNDVSFNGTAVTTRAAPIPFECPAAFLVTQEVEIDNGIFVTCDELKPFYEIPIPVDVGV